jgi:hypothetical protein
MVPKVHGTLINAENGATTNDLHPLCLVTTNKLPVYICRLLGEVKMGYLETGRQNAVGYLNGKRRYENRALER